MDNLRDRCSFGVRVKINHVVRTMILSDFFINSGFAMFAPIFAVFVTNQISNGSVQVVGFATAITQVVKITLQIPIARFLDKNHGEIDDYYALLAGTALCVSVPFMYFFAATPAHIYVIQAIYGVGLALAVPPWFAIFTRHMDKLHANIEWSFESVAIGLSSAGAAALGGVLAAKYGFQHLFILGGLLAVLGGGLQIRIFKDLKRHVARGMVKPHPGRQAE